MSQCIEIIQHYKQLLNVSVLGQAQWCRHIVRWFEEVDGSPPLGEVHVLLVGVCCHQQISAPTLPHVGQSSQVVLMAEVHQGVAGQDQVKPGLQLVRYNVVLLELPGSVTELGLVSLNVGGHNVVTSELNVFPTFQEL